MTTQAQYEMVPVYMVYIVHGPSVYFICEGLKDTTTDTKEAHYFIHENAAKKYCQLFNDKAIEHEEAHTIRVFVDLGDVKEQTKRTGEYFDGRLLDIWEKIMRRVWR